MTAWILTRGVLNHTRFEICGYYKDKNRAIRVAELFASKEVDSSHLPPYKWFRVERGEGFGFAEVYSRVQDVNADYAYDRDRYTIIPITIED